GSSSGIRNPSLLRTTADNRARNEMAKVFETYTASLMKDYAASTTAGDFSKTSEEQHVEQAIKTVVSTTLNGVEIIDHWQNPENMDLYSLARLDLDSFKDNLDKMKELNAKVRDYVRGNAERLHEQLEKEEGKAREREGR
ncbi:MAG: LPP20 family lipoprotein, partial [Nitrospirota bacterium]